MSSASGVQSVSASVDAHEHPPAFRHDAFLYEDSDEFLAGAMAFAGAALAAGEPLIVALERSKIVLLKSELGSQAEGVHFVDVRVIGANPARLIPAWRRFIDLRAVRGARVWGIGEPVWPERSEAEVTECHRHEALVGVAFADVPELSLLCPYDTSALAPAVIDGARRTHPTVLEHGARRASPTYTGLAVAGSLEDPLPEPRALALTLAFGTSELAEIRRNVDARALAAGLTLDRREDIVLAVNEIATNSIRHGGGRGVLRIWRDPDALICEVADRGLIDDPLAGRERPGGAQVGGYGLWLANQVCDLVQVRSGTGGSTVRVHMRTG